MNAVSLSYYHGWIQNFSQEGTATPSKGCLPNILIKFSENPCENKEILVCRRVCAGSDPLRSATDYGYSINKVNTISITLHCGHIRRLWFMKFCWIRWILHLSIPNRKFWTFWNLDISARWKELVCLGTFMISRPTLGCSHWWEFVIQNTIIIQWCYFSRCHNYFSFFNNNSFQQNCRNSDWSCKSVWITKTVNADLRY